MPLVTVHGGLDQIYIFDSTQPQTSIKTKQNYRKNLTQLNPQQYGLQYTCIVTYTNQYHKIKIRIDQKLPPSNPSIAHTEASTIDPSQLHTTQPCKRGLEILVFNPSCRWHSVHLRRFRAVEVPRRKTRKPIALSTAHTTFSASRRPSSNIGRVVFVAEFSECWTCNTKDSLVPKFGIE